MRHAPQRKPVISAGGFRNVGTVVPVICLVVYSFLLLAFLRSNDYAPGSLIHFGERYLKREQLRLSVPNVTRDGYDGQFYFALALDPTVTGAQSPVTLDAAAYRQQRILFPLVAGFLGHGSQTAIPIIMAALNIAALALLGVLAVRITPSRAIWPGLAVVLYPGFLFSTLHSTPEPIACCLVVAGVAGFRAGRLGLAAVLLTLATFTRETSLVVAVAVACVVARSLLQGKSSRGESSGNPLGLAAAVLPIVAFLVWQLMLHSRWNAWPAVAGGQQLGVPFRGLLSVIGERMRMGGDLRANGYDILLLAGFALLVIGLLRALPSEVTFTALVAGGYFLLVLCASEPIWEYRGGFLRALSEFYVFSILSIAHASPRRSTTVSVYWLVMFCGMAVGVL